MDRQSVRRRIETVGIIPAVRVSSAEEALLAAEAVCRGGIPIIEISFRDAVTPAIISFLQSQVPDLVVGAGGITDLESAQRCLDAGATFLATDGYAHEIVELALSRNIVAIPGTLTPSEVMTAWRVQPDFVKVVPCGQIGGESYIRALKAMFPAVPLIAAGGVTQHTASSFILAGAVAVGIGADLIPREAVRTQQADRIAELARRFCGFVSAARRELAGR
jgi:2-dehydro-3-deoxyphosphogluconate aldolase / (4S)-4-hydroxy-2-oxoglutarate aldolase